MADWHGVISHGSGGGGDGGGGYSGRSSVRNEDLEEEDVWSAMESEDSSPNMRKAKDYYPSSSSSSAWRFPTAPRMIPKGNNSASTSSTTTTTHESKMVVKQSSAPLHIPDWSKIYGKNAKMGDTCGGADDYYQGYSYNNDNEDDDDDMVPPHEWLARKLARNRISSFSVCEGIGRTLKGRDLSKVRNAVLTKTGFLE